MIQVVGIKNIYEIGYFCREWDDTHPHIKVSDMKYIDNIVSEKQKTTVLIYDVTFCNLQTKQEFLKHYYFVIHY